METESSSKTQNPGGRGFFLFFYFFNANVLLWKPLSCGGGGSGGSRLITGSEMGGVWGLTEAQLGVLGVCGG